jgi:hypothetical protein
VGVAVEVDLEFSEAVNGGGPEPAVELGGGVGPAAQVDGEAAAGAPVRVEDAGDVAGGVALDPWLVDVEVERGGAPYRCRHREERIRVRAPALVGRREMMSPRTPSGRPLMRSSTRSCSSSCLLF